MKKIGIVLLMLLLLTSCGGKKEVKKESLESKVAKEAFAVIDSVKSAYIKRDIKAIGSHSTKEGLVYITKDLAKFDTVELALKPVWVEIEADRVILNVSWQGKWQKGLNTIDEKGMAVFVLKDKPLKVDRILRSNPFEYPE